MSEHVTWTWELSIKDLDGFKQLMAEMIETTKSEDGVILYEWYLSDDGATAQILERYATSEQAMEHMKGFGAVASRFFEVCTPGRLTVLGSPGEDLRKAQEGARPTYFSMLDGFNK